MAAVYTYIYSKVDERGQQNNEWKTREKYAITFGIVSILLSIVAISTMTFLLFLMQESQTMDNKKPIACVVCTSSRQENKDNRNSFSNCTMVLLSPEEVKDGADRLCAYNSEQMSALFALVGLKQVGKQADLPEYIPSDFMFSPVSAHKQLFPPLTDRVITVPYFEDERLVQARFSQKNDPLIEHVRGLEVHNGGFQILYSGLYLVYSSLHFSPHSSLPCKNFKFKTWGHYVEKFVMNFPGRSGVLMKAFHTCCDECTNDHETSFLNGLFELQKGDMIRVNISGHGLVLFQKESSFAGLVMLRSRDNDGQNLPNA